LDVGGQASFAVWDRALQEVVVVTPDAGAAGGLRVWRAPAPGQRAVDILLADLVGSAAPDLVVVMSNPLSRDAVLVYPDQGDASPALAWAQGSPGTPARGVDHAMAVDASDADGPPPRVDWLVGDPAGTPVAQGASYTHPGASLCAFPPPDLAVTVRATDDLGVFTEISATLPVAASSPAISIASPSGRLVVEPGGTTAILEGTLALACGATGTWGGNWPAGATFTDGAPQGSTLRRTVSLPEVTYPELLAGTTVVTLATSDPVPAPVASLTVDVDASGLVEIHHEADRPILAEGDVAVLKTRIRSRVGVPLPLVRMVDVLAGLAPAGAPRVSGAAMVEVRGSGAEVVVDALPPAPAVVEIELPVSSLGGRGASAVEVRSSGGYLLTPAAGAGRTTETSLGCGCGSSPGGALALAALLALTAPRRRRRPAEPPPLT
ncbi:MAG TPA: MYXO-CTERM sorting domain-containing protein, partial [Anaeromyxobacter sp.]